MMDKTKKVYIAECIGPNGQPIGAYKIGCSQGWNDRIKSVTVNLPFTLELVAVVPGGMFMEAVCHLHLKSERIGGEYFKATDRMRKFAERAANEGEAFYYVKDSGALSSGKDLGSGLLSYHGISLKEACDKAGLNFSYYASADGSIAKSSKKILAGIALVAASKQQFVNWPEDGYKGLLGKTYLDVAPATGAAA